MLFGGMRRCGIFAPSEACSSRSVPREVDGSSAKSRVTVTLLDDELMRLWDAPVHTAALRWGM